MDREKKETELRRTGGRPFSRAKIVQKSWLLGFFLFVHLAAYAQGGREELLGIIAEHKGDTAEVDAYNKLYRLDRRVDPNRALMYLETAFRLAKGIGYPKGEAFSLISFGDYFMDRGEYDRATKAFEASQAISQSIGDYEAVSAVINNKGILAAKQSDFTLALEHFFNSARIKEMLGDTIRLGSSYQNIGATYMRLNQSVKAIEYFEKALKFKTLCGDSAGIVVSVGSIASALSSKGEYAKALEIQKHNLGMANRVSDPYEIAGIINTIGVQYQMLNKPDTARLHYLLALDIYKKIDQKQELAMQYINLGELETVLGKGISAIAYLDSGMTIASSMGAKVLVSEACRRLAEANKLLGNFEKAYGWSEQFHAMDDSLKGVRVKAKINDLELKYESEKKDKEIAELEEKEAKALSAAEWWSAFLIVVITLATAAIASLLLYISVKRAKENHRKAELEHRALRSQMNPHFLFNSLGAIQQMYLSGEADLANNYLGDFAKLLRKILENSGKRTISVKEEVEMLRLYLELERERTNRLVEFEIILDEKIDKFGTQVPPLVIQPFVENAIWHGILPKKAKGRITVRLDLSDNLNALLCIVEDNGVGMRDGVDKKNHLSKGIEITEQRLGTKVKFEYLNPGTRVIIKIPI